LDGTEAGGAGGNPVKGERGGHLGPELGGGGNGGFCGGGGGGKSSPGSAIRAEEQE